MLNPPLATKSEGNGANHVQKNIRTINGIRI